MQGVIVLQEQDRTIHEHDTIPQTSSSASIKSSTSASDASSSSFFFGVGSVSVFAGAFFCSAAEVLQLQVRDRKSGLFARKSSAVRAALRVAMVFDGSTALAMTCPWTTTGADAASVFVHRSAQSPQH